MRGNKPIRATRDFGAVFYCPYCGREFVGAEKLEIKRVHEKICEKLGYSATPRPEDLSEFEEEE